MVAPLIRILLRYGIGAIGGVALGDQLSNDPDIVAAITPIAAFVGGAVVELWYALAKRWGWRT